MLIGLFWLPLIFSFFVVFVITPFVIAFSKRFGLVDDPRKNKHPKVIHKMPIPRGGGIAIYFSVLLSCLLFLPKDAHLLGILSGLTLLTFVGVLDDKYDLNPYLRLLMQFGAAIMPIATGIGVSFISSPLGGVVDLSQPQVAFYFWGESRSIWILSDIFAMFWIVALMNFLNMGAKGVDGQLTGVVAIASFFVAVMALRFSADITEWPVIVLASITMGAYFGFLPYHIFPQKIMPSFSGSNIGGYMLAVMSILTTTKVGVLAIVLAVPLIDTTYTVARRILTGNSPVWGDDKHLHHRLMKFGLTRAQVAYVYWGLSLVLGLIAIQLTTKAKFYAFGLLALTIGVVILLLPVKKNKK